MHQKRFNPWQVSRFGYAEIFRGRDKVFTLGWLPLFAMMVVAISLDLLRENIFLVEIWSQYGGHINYAHYILNCFCLAVFAFAIFRWQIRGWPVQTRAFSLKRGGLVFLGLVTLYIVVDQILWEIFWRFAEWFDGNFFMESGNNKLSDWSVFALGLILVARFAFALPFVVQTEKNFTGTRSDGNLSDQAWQLGEGSWTRLVALTCFTLGVLMFWNWAISYVVIRHLTMTLPYPMMMLVSVFLTLKWAVLCMAGIAVAAAALCEAYRVRTANFSEEELIKLDLDVSK